MKNLIELRSRVEESERILQRYAYCNVASQSIEEKVQMDINRMQLDGAFNKAKEAYMLALRRFVDGERGEE